jgi:hypothetical protein
MWRGDNYNFTYGEPVDFVTWRFLLDVTDAVREMLYEVIADKNIQAITDEIQDPFANIAPPNPASS